MFLWSLSDSRGQLWGKIVHFSPLGPTRVYLFWRWKQYCHAFTLVTIDLWQVYRVNCPNNPPYCTQTVSIILRHFWIHGTFWSAGCDTNWFGRQDKYRRCTIQHWQYVSVSSWKVRCDSAKCRAICISYDKKLQTFLHFLMSNFDASPNDLSILEDYKGPFTSTTCYKNRAFCGNLGSITRRSSGLLIEVGPTHQTLLSIQNKLQSTLPKGKRRRNISSSITLFKPSLKILKVTGRPDGQT